MKTLFTMLCLMLWSYGSSAQNIQYDYDAGGNRILRKPSGALPVTLINFTAEKREFVAGSEDATALLQWQTSAEINFDRFIMQRSQDGKSWLDVGEIRPTGKSNPENNDIPSRYSFEDQTPAEGKNLYRLKMLDKDGSFAYSHIRVLNFELLILVYPNPVSSMLTLKWAALRTVQVYSNSGKMVYETSGEASTIDVSELSAGVYIFKLLGKDGNSVLRKIVKE